MPSLIPTPMLTVLPTTIIERSTTMSQRRGINDAEFLKQSYNYPNWPFCPVKRWRDDRLQCGLVFDGLPVVVMVNMFMLPIAPEEYDKLEKHKYSSFEDLVADGWLVD